MIIKEILSSHKTELLNNNVKIPRSKTIKFENINRKNKYILNNDNKSFDTSKSVPFKSKGINIANKIKIKKDENDNKGNIYYNGSDLIEVNFVQFLLNNVYFKRKNRMKQKHPDQGSQDLESGYFAFDRKIRHPAPFSRLRYRKAPVPESALPRRCEEAAPCRRSGMSQKNHPRNSICSRRYKKPVPAPDQSPEGSVLP